jgi:5-amino-6-(5-phosphoribosylamino)uracil reductase
VADRPYTILSCCISLDGYLDGALVKRLPMSNEADFDRVDGVRADSDAILVGAETVRNDNPRLFVRSDARRNARLAQGLSGSPTKVTVTEHGKLDACADFFVTGDADKLVYCASMSFEQTRASIERAAIVIDAGETVHMSRISEDLYTRGVRRLLVEGGGTILTQFLTNELADELHLVIAPFFVGDSRARRFVGDGNYPWNPGRRGTLADVCHIGDVVLLRYALSPRFAVAEVHA